MMCSQFLIGTVLLSVVVLVYLTTSAQCYGPEDTLPDTKPCHRLKKGKRLFGDVVLVNETIKEDTSAGLPKVSRDLQYPLNRERDDYYLITRIDIHDKGNGGFARLTDGGPGFEFVAFNLYTYLNVKFEFQVLVYGYFN